MISPSTFETSIDDIDMIKNHRGSFDTLPTVSLNGSSSSSLSMDNYEHHEDSNHHQALHLSQSIMEDDNLHTHYDILPQVVGEGSFGFVRQCIQRLTGEYFAVKSIVKSQTSTGTFQREVELLNIVNNHQNIVTIEDVFEDDQYFHIITDLCTGGELFDLINEQTEQNPLANSTLFSETQAAGMLYSILHSVAHLHDKDIVHRDLKPENFLFSTKSRETLKLIDFGLAVTHDEHYDAPMADIVGTPCYMAPEVLKQDYTKACDMWSVGVIAYTLLYGHRPFDGEDDKEIFAKIRCGQFSLDHVAVSDDAKDFIKCLLKRDPRRRWTSESAMQHPWIVQQLAKIVP